MTWQISLEFISTQLLYLGHSTGRQNPISSHLISHCLTHTAFARGSLGFPDFFGSPTLSFANRHQIPWLQGVYTRGKWGEKKKVIPGLIQEVSPVVLTMPLHAVNGSVLMLPFDFKHSME